MQYDKQSGMHYIHCALCVKSGKFKMGDPKHATGRQHMTHLQTYGVPDIPFQKSWTYGWRWGPSAPNQLTLQQAHESYNVDLGA